MLKKEIALSTQQKWGLDLQLDIPAEEWSSIYFMPFTITKDTFLQNVHFKLMHRILPCNSFLYKCNLKETELCTFCNETKERLFHIFWECNIVQNFWLSIKQWFAILGIVIPYCPKQIIFGVDKEHPFRDMINHVFLILKYYIFKCKCKDLIPCQNGGIEYLKYCIRNEKFSVYLLSPAQKERVNRKWMPLEAVTN